MFANSVRLAVTTTIGVVFCASGAFVLTCAMGGPDTFLKEGGILETPSDACSLLLHVLLWLVVLGTGIGLLLRRPSARVLSVATLSMALFTGVFDVVRAFLSLPLAASTRETVLNRAYLSGVIVGCLWVFGTIVALSALALGCLGSRAEPASSPAPPARSADDQQASRQPGDEAHVQADVRPTGIAQADDI